jgi:hypothetical protein
VKYLLSLFLLFGLSGTCLAQESSKDALSQKDTSKKPVSKPVIQKTDTAKAKQPVVKKTDTVRAKQPVTKKPDSSQIKRPALQRPDSLNIRQPVAQKVDSQRRARPDSNSVKAAVPVRKVSSTPRPQIGWAKANDLLKTHPYFNFLGKPRFEVIVKRTDSGKEGLFYLLTGVVLYFALVRLLFAKYMTNLFSVFFRVSLKQKQIREQLLQSPLPSLLLNIFFIISGGIYISFLLQYYNFRGTSNLWYLMMNSTIALGLVYLTKFIILKITGWIFNISEATDTYAFIVFLVNKLLGILLIPFLILLAFSAAPVVAILVTLSFTMLAVFFAYRYIISYAPVRKEIKVSQFHFILYLCAFEIIPLLLIYKVLLTFLEKSS